MSSNNNQLIQPNFEHQITLQSSPVAADIAIASIDINGTPGSLNEYVLQHYKYSVSVLETLDFSQGYALLNSGGRKPILFIVTIDGHSPAHNLSKNLYEAIKIYKYNLINKKIWIPLMGTGYANLSSKESYNLTVQILNRLNNEYNLNSTFFIFSLPINSETLYDEIVNKNDLNFSYKEIPTSPNQSFYVVGTIWESDDQLDRFYDEEIWELGYKDRYQEIIKEIIINDIVIAKSTFADRDGESYLRIKAIGYITNKISDTKYKVNWVAKDIYKDIAGLGHYRNSIAKVYEDDLDKILEGLNLQSFSISAVNNAFNKIADPKTKNTILPGLLCDTDTGEDFLEISKDVAAFARVIAARSFHPPLAIALFGKWGSGKSFFMNKLKERIIFLSRNNPKNIYCEGITHIHFNAWSYIDANLWASIITRIFESLNNYIKNDAAEDSEKQAIKKTLTERLNITQEQLEKTQEETDAINSHIQYLSEQKTTQANNLKEALQRIEHNTLEKVLEKINDEFHISQRIDEALSNNESFLKTRKELSVIIPEEYWSNPSKLYKESKSAYTFLRTNFLGKGAWVNIIWIAFIIIAVLNIPIIIDFVSLIIGKLDFTLSPQTLLWIGAVGTFVAKGIATFKKLLPIITAFWEIKSDYENKKNITISKFKQKEKAIILEIERIQNELISLDEEIRKAEALKTTLLYKLENGLSTEALYQFIEKRSNTEDYKRHLGVISIIRKDLEILSSLFDQHNTELVSATDKHKFLSHFKNPLERIVLYIDDLDRCPEENVVQVLEAVNLLMAFPLFIVVVGVDSRWVKNALIKKHHLQFGGTDNKEFEKIEAGNYLEKIFQVAFQLKESKNENVKKMIAKLADAKPELKYRPITSLAEKDDDIPWFQTENDLSEVDFKEDLNSDNQINENFIEFMDEPEALIITVPEVKLLQDMSDIIGTNPRSIKRLINTYRIIKAHEDFTYDKNSETWELLIIFFILSLHIGKFNCLFNLFEEYTGKHGQEALKTLKEFLIEQENSTDHKLAQSAYQLQIILGANNIFKDLLRTMSQSFNRHYNFIKRFTLNK